MPIDDLPTLDLLIMVAACVASGLVRGFTGGAGANFFNAPVLSILIGPREAVPIVLLLNAVTNVQLIPGAVRHVRWREALPIAIAAAPTLPNSTMGCQGSVIIEHSTKVAPISDMPTANAQRGPNRSGAMPAIGAISAITVSIAAAVPETKP